MYDDYDDQEYDDDDEECNDDDEEENDDDDGVRWCMVGFPVTRAPPQGLRAPGHFPEHQIHSSSKVIGYYIS